MKINSTKVLPLLLVIAGCLGTSASALPRLSLNLYDTLDTSNSVVKTSVDANIKTNLNASTSNNNEASASGTMATPTTVDGSTGTNTNINANLILQANDFGVQIQNASQVGTEADLNIYEENAKVVNSNVEKITADTNTDGTTEVTVKYKHPGKFLGIIPVNYTSTTVVTTGTSSAPVVKSKLSLWGHLVTDKVYDEQKIESRIANNANIKSNLGLNISASAKAKIAEAVVNELKLYASENASSTNQ